MRKRIFILPILLFASTISVLCQTTEELEARNGFKDIKLATDINQYEGLEFEEEIENDRFGMLQVYTRKKNQYTSIGESIVIEDLKVRVYNGDIYEIQIILEKNPKMYGGLKKAFGPPKFDIVTNDYFWQSPSLKLVYRSYDKNSLEMVYHSKVIDRQLEVEKDEEIDEIASDF